MKFLFVLVSFFLAVSPLRGEEIVLWHAFDGALEKVFLEIVDDFNAGSDHFTVKALKKGNYREILEEGVSAFSAKRHPHLLQVYEVATLRMLHMPEMFLPVDALMRKYSRKFDPDIYIDAVKNFYATADGKMLSFPWNVSTGILFYNKEAFAKAGLNPEEPPNTWEELETCARKLVEAGYIGFTTAWPAAYHLEHVCAFHNLPFATMSNGFAGEGAQLIFNAEGQVFHLSKLCAWAKENIFAYAGRFNEAPEELFTSGKAAILLQGAKDSPFLRKRPLLQSAQALCPTGRAWSKNRTR